MAGTDELFLKIADVVMFVWRIDTVVFLTPVMVEELTALEDVLLVMAKVGLVVTAVIVVLAWLDAMVLFASLLETVALTTFVLELVMGACHGLDQGLFHGLPAPLPHSKVLFVDDEVFAAVDVEETWIVEELVLRELAEVLAEPSLTEDVLEEIVFDDVVPETDELSLTEVELEVTTAELSLEELETGPVLAELDKLMEEDAFDVLLADDVSFVELGPLAVVDLINEVELEELELVVLELVLKLLVLELELATTELELEFEVLVDDTAATVGETLKVFELDVILLLLDVVLKLLDEFGTLIDELDVAMEELVLVELEAAEEVETAADISELEDVNLAVLEDDSAVLEDDLAVLGDDLVVLEDGSAVLEKGLEMLEDDFTVLEVEIEELEDKVEELEDEIEVLEDEVAELETTSGLTDGDAVLEEAEELIVLLVGTEELLVLVDVDDDSMLLLELWDVELVEMVLEAAALELMPLLRVDVAGVAVSVELTLDEVAVLATALVEEGRTEELDMEVDEELELATLLVLSTTELGLVLDAVAMADVEDVALPVVDPDVLLEVETDDAEEEVLLRVIELVDRDELIELLIGSDDITAAATAVEELDGLAELEMVEELEAVEEVETGEEREIEAELGDAEELEGTDGFEDVAGLEDAAEPEDAEELEDAAELEDVDDFEDADELKTTGELVAPEVLELEPADVLDLDELDASEADELVTAGAREVTTTGVLYELGGATLEVETEEDLSVATLEAVEETALREEAAVLEAVAVLEAAAVLEAPVVDDLASVDAPDGGLLVTGTALATIEDNVELSTCEPAALAML